MSPFLPALHLTSPLSLAVYSAQMLSLLPLVEAVVSKGIKRHDEENDAVRDSAEDTCAVPAREVMQKIADAKKHLKDLPCIAMSTEEVLAERDRAKRRLERGAQAECNAAKVRRRLTTAGGSEKGDL